ncbi:MAG: nitroreductase family protein [Candidatus Omnitrophica bacterium]|nr:nitroreductase family protein [Candidatus Omnitrophota bacterium]
MSIYKTILRRRSIRKFKQIPIPYKILKKMVNAARLAPSAANLQPCEFIVVDKRELLDQIFSALRWAAYLGKRGIPGFKQRPTVYIIILLNKNIRKKAAIEDAAAAIENILLVATEERMGSCWIGSIDKQAIRKILNIPKRYSIEYVVALGYPKEKSVIEDLKKDQCYWRDRQGLFHVPKRSLKDILHRNGFYPPSQNIKHSW